MEVKAKYFDTFGVMIDCSRNAVMKISELKQFIALLSRMGYNQVQLYTEDTYEVDNEPYFGYFRGRYTQEELKELDDYAQDLGVELIPCIQTLAHLNAIFQWTEYKTINDIDSILLVRQERTYQLIENMISSLRKCFRSKKIHIGMDEAVMLGKGKFFDLYGEQNRTEILLEHLKRVCAITDKYGFEPMMWSDMFYRIANGGEYYSPKSVFHSEIKNQIPEKITLIYWDYYHTDKKTYAKMISGHHQLSDKIMFAGGAWKWGGFTPHNDFAVRTIKAALNACIEGGIRNAFITLWGDDGAETSVYAVLPALCYAACMAQGITALKEIKEKFFEWTGCSYEDFMLLDLPDRAVLAKEKVVKAEDGLFNPSKYELYNDCFMGIFDTAIVPDESKKYKTFAAKLKNAAKRNGKYSYLFETASRLCTLLSYKATIGIRTRKVYADGNGEALDELIADYKKMIKLTEEFYTAFKNQWYLENKPHGFDVQDIRLGGLIMRMKSCLERLISYRDGETVSIPELEEEVLALHTKKTYHNNWKTNVTANVL